MTAEQGITKFFSWGWPARPASSDLDPLVEELVSERVAADATNEIDQIRRDTLSAMTEAVAKARRQRILEEMLREMSP